MVTAGELRDACGLLDWSQQELADRAQVGVVTVRQLEAAAHEPRRATLDVIRRCFEGAGVEFIDENGGGPGVPLRKRSKEKTRKGFRRRAAACLPKACEIVQPALRPIFTHKSPRTRDEPEYPPAGAL